ncbi:MAG: mannose-6-phosphate isomerase, class I [Lentisphaerae bacterium RIFOXYB12_FULL_65_16]|nr:MAG: mannose-6-phosphate isomerase, class I [Lentisphaerae bacterium RIFOXYA12_64_32]OGV87118.1 MAG: mannose-6-phosphate isomerase, class I [Lentisphaerae bacterium RIFOXYB12_FULL_65_16]
MSWDRPIELRCGVQHYAWGGRGHDGQPPFIADLLGEREPGHRPYAELWVGAHPSLSAQVVHGTGVRPLSDEIAAFPEEILGRRLFRRGLSTLPFLLKVLDCHEPLSIQAHPDQALAERLHRRDPKNYPDANHKPEIAIALTPFRALCGFRPWEQIRADVVRRAALREFFGTDLGMAAGHVPAARLRRLWSRLLTAPDAEVAGVLQKLTQTPAAEGSGFPADQLCLHLVHRFPGDRGCIAAYFLNLLNIAPGEAVFLGAGEPHAYLCGTIVECMANSDNVVRAGLTPKFIDREVLLEMLTYDDVPPLVRRGRVGAHGERIYEVPTPEFRVEIWRQEAGAAWRYSGRDTVSLLLVLSGAVRLRNASGVESRAQRGTAWLWPAACGSLEVTAEADATEVVRAMPAG